AGSLSPSPHTHTFCSISLLFSSRSPLSLSHRPASFSRGGRGGCLDRRLHRSSLMEKRPTRPAVVPPSTSDPSRDCAAPESSLPSALFSLPSWCTRATQRLLHEHAYYAAAQLHVARAGPTAPPSLSTSASALETPSTPSRSAKHWLTCATAGVAGTCGVIVGVRLSPWLSRRATRLYSQREAKYRNPLRLLPSPAAVARPESWGWRSLWHPLAPPRGLEHQALTDARRPDYGHPAEWLAACIGYRWLPWRISQPTLLKLYSVRHSRQSSTDRDTDKEVRWGTRMINKGAHTLTKHSTAAAATKPTTTSLIPSVLLFIVRLARAPLQKWQPRPQHLVDVFVSATCQSTEKPPSTSAAAAPPLLCLPRQGFALLYDPVARLSVWCGYYVTRDTVDRARRQSRCLTFFTDRSLEKTVRRVPAEMKARGYDRGHLAPHASVAASAQAAIEAALLSNVQLQHHQINRGVWRWLEAATRAYVRQLPLALAPRAMARQQQPVRNKTATGAAGGETSSPSDGASFTQAGPTSSAPHCGSSVTPCCGRPPKSASSVPASSISCTPTRGQAAKRINPGGPRQGLLRDSELIARLLAAPGVGSGAAPHLRLHRGAVWGCAARTLRYCWAGQWWQWWRHCSGRALSRHCEREVAVNVGPLYYKQRNDVGQGDRQCCGTTALSTPATTAISPTAISLSRHCGSGSRKVHQRRRRGDRVSPPTWSSSPSPQSLFIPDAFFFSLWDVHTHEHVHLIVPNRPDAASIQAVTAAVAARRSRAAAGPTASRPLPSQRRQHNATPPSQLPSEEDLETTLRSLVVPTVKLERLFAESLVELRSRCRSASGMDVASRNTTSKVEHAASSVALRTSFSLFPVYRQRWLWQQGGSGSGSR
ncbi:hypothetical protein MNV84_01782, partial [Leishmania braziliensis]